MSKTTQNKEKSGSQTAESAAQLIEARIKGLNDWRGPMLKLLRKLIKQADPEIIEEVKWIKPSNPLGVIAWSHGGLICTGEVYKTAVKMTFPKGASLNDPQGLFNSCLEGSARRAIDFHEGNTVNEQALRNLIQAAVNQNTTSKR